MSSSSYINDSRHGSRGTSPSPYKRSASIASTSYGGGGGSGVGDGQTHTSRTRTLARELAKETTPATLRDLEPLRHDIEKIKADLRNLERKNKFVSPDVVDTTWRELLNVKAFIGYNTGPGGRTPPGGRTWSSYHQHFLEDDKGTTNENSRGERRLLIEGAHHERIRRGGEGDEDTEKERAQSQRMKQKGDLSDKGGTSGDKAFNIESSVAGSDSDGGQEGIATPPRGPFGNGSRKQTKAAKPHTLASLAASGAAEEIVVNADGTTSRRASQSPSNLGGHTYSNNNTNTKLADVEALSPLTADDLFYGGSSSLTAVATTPAGQPKTPSSSSAAAAGGGSGAQGGVAVTPNSAHFTSLGFGASFGPEALRKVIAYEVAEAMKAYDLKYKQEREQQQREKEKTLDNKANNEGRVTSIGTNKGEAGKDHGDSEDERHYHHNHDTFRRGGCYNTDFVGSHCCERNAEVHLEANRRLRIYLDEANRRAQLVQSFTSHWLISLSREHGRLIEVYDAHLSSLHRTNMNDVEVFLRQKDSMMRGVPLPSGADDRSCEGSNITGIIVSGGEEEGLNSYHHGIGTNSEAVATNNNNNKNKNTSHFYDHVVGGRAAATSLTNPQHMNNHLQEQHLQQQDRRGGGGGGDFLYSPPFAPEQSYHNQLLRREHLARAAEDESEAEDDENVDRVLKRKLGGVHGHLGVGGRQHYHHLDPFASPPALNSHVTGTAYSNLVSDRFRAKAEALVTIIREDPYLVEKIGSAVFENKCVERAMRNDLVLARRELPASVSSALGLHPSDSVPSQSVGVAPPDLVSSDLLVQQGVYDNSNNSNAVGSGVNHNKAPSWLSIIDEVTAAQSEAAIERAVEHFDAIVEDKIVPRLNTLAHSKIKEVNENTKVALRAAEKFIEKRQADSAAAVENSLNTLLEERSATLKETAEEEAKSVVNAVLVDRIRECEGLMKQLAIEREHIKSCMDDARREDTHARDVASRRLWEALFDGMTATTSRQLQHHEKEKRTKGNGVAVEAAEAHASSLLSRLLLPPPASSSGTSPSELAMPSAATQHSTRPTKNENETSVLFTEQGLLEAMARIGGAITKPSALSSSSFYPPSFCSPSSPSSSLMDSIAFSAVSDEEAASFIKAVRAMKIDVEAYYDDENNNDASDFDVDEDRSDDDARAPRLTHVLAALQPAASLLSELKRLIQNYNKRIREEAEAEEEEGTIQQRYSSKKSLMTLAKLTALLNTSQHRSRLLNTLLEKARKAIFSMTTAHHGATSSSPTAQQPLPLPLLLLPSWQTLATLALSIAKSEYSKSERIEADRLAILRSAVKEQLPLKNNNSNNNRRNQAKEERGTNASDASDNEKGAISTRNINRRMNNKNNNDNTNKYVKAHREHFGHPIITALRVHWHFILSCTATALPQCARDVGEVYGHTVDDNDNDNKTTAAARSESSDSAAPFSSRQNRHHHQHQSLPPQHPNNGSNNSRNVSVTAAFSSQRVVDEDDEDHDDDANAMQLHNASTHIQSIHSATALMLRNQHLSRVPRSMTEESRRRDNSLHRNEGGRGGDALLPHSSVPPHHPYGVGVSGEGKQQRGAERSSSRSSGRDLAKNKSASAASSPLALLPYSSSLSSPNVDDPTKPLAIAISQLADALNAGNERARSQQQQHYHSEDSQPPPSALQATLEQSNNSRKQEELRLRKMLAEAELRYRNVQKEQQQQQQPPQHQYNNILHAQPSFSSSPAPDQNQQPPFQAFHRQELATPATAGGGGTRAAAALFRGASTASGTHQQLYNTTMMAMGASPDVQRGGAMMGVAAVGGGPLSYSPYPHQPTPPQVVEVGDTTAHHPQHQHQQGSSTMMAAVGVAVGEKGDGGMLGLGKSAVREADALVSKVETTAAARRMKRESSSGSDRHVVVPIVPPEEAFRLMSYEESEEETRRRTTDGRREGHADTQQQQLQNNETENARTTATTVTTGISSSKKKKITVYHHHHSYVSSAASSVTSSSVIDNDNGFHATDVAGGGGGVTKIRTLSGGMAPPPPSPPTEIVTAAAAGGGVPPNVRVATNRNSKLAIGATRPATAALAPVAATTTISSSFGGVGGMGVSNNGGGGGFYTAASAATIAGRSTSVQQKPLSTRVAAAPSQHNNNGGQQHHQQHGGQFYRSSSSSAAAPSLQRRA